MTAMLPPQQTHPHGASDFAYFRRALVLLVKNPVDQALFELGMQADGPKQISGLAVIFEKLVEEGVGIWWFDSDV